MMLILPKNIRSIISIMHEAGYSAHAVGGCVRDSLMGRTPKDWDITTNALPEQVKSLFEKTYDTGLKHGTVTVSFGDDIVEVTTWRSETAYSDHRRPDAVHFTDSLEKDLSRRDFTMNAIAYNDFDGLVDPFEGQKDIRKGLIRCVGEPDRRFSEDALRMLRAVRFSAQLGFQIEDRTFNAILVHSKDISYISMERIQAELNKILDSHFPEKMALLWETGLSKIPFPNIAGLPSRWTQLCSLPMRQNERRILLLGALFHLGFRMNPAREAASQLKRLKYDNKTIGMVAKLVQCLSELKAISKRNIRRMAAEYGKTVSKMALMIYQGLGEALNMEDLTARPEDAAKPAVSGLDLKQANLGAGREIGMLLSALSLCLYERPELNDRDTLMLLAKIMKSRF